MVFRAGLAPHPPKCPIDPEALPVSHPRRMPPTPSRVLSGFAPFLAAVLLHTFNATVSGQDTSGGTLVLNTGNPPPSESLPPITSVVTSGSISLGGVTSSGGSYTLVGGSSSGGTLIIGTPPYTPPPPLPPLTLLSVHFFGASGSTPLNTTLFSSPGYAVVGPGQLSVQGATVTWGYISEGNTFLLGTPFSTGYGTTIPLSGSTLVLDGNFLAASGSNSTIPDSVLASGPEFSSVIVIQPPVVQPPPVTPPPVTEPPVTQPPTTEPPVIPPPVIQPPVVQPPVVVQPPQPPPPPPNQPPVAINPRLAHSGQTPLTIQKSSLATDSDGDSLNFTVVASPGFGSVSVEQDTITYTPSANYLGGDIFKVQCTDGRGGTAESTIALANRFANLDGDYFGTLPGRGALYATVDRFGTGTFKIRLDSQSVAGVFTLNPGGPTTLELPIEYGALGRATLTLDFTLGAIPTLQGIVGGAASPGTFVCVESRPVDISASFAGQYNAELVANTGSLKSPFGFAIIQVEPNGFAKITGRLPNGKPWSASSKIGEVGELRILVPTKSGTLLEGEISLPSASGVLSWSSPAGPQNLRVTGGRFEKQIASGRNVFGEAQTDGFVSLGSPAISKSRLDSVSALDRVNTMASKPSVTSIRIDGSNRVKQLAHVPPLVSLTIKPDGRFNGTYRSPKANGLLRFTGVLQSSKPHGLGVITSGHGGYVLIDEPTQATLDQTTSSSASDPAGLVKTGAGTLVIGGSNTSFSGVVMNWVAGSEADRATALSQLLLTQSSTPERAPIVPPSDTTATETRR